MSPSFIDYILAPSLVCLSFMILLAKDLFVSIVLFIVFGLLVALAWVELKAPDIALVEAAVGAGVLGALLLGVLGRLEHNKKAAVRTTDQVSVIAITLLILGTAILGRVLYALPQEAYGIGPGIRSLMDRAGGANPVTAVILNFRGYDTLLEIGVLFLVSVGAKALVSTEKQPQERVMPKADRIILFFLNLLIPVMILVAFYLLWVGADAPGGAFQAGAILAASGILLYLSDTGFSLNFDSRWTLLGVSLGLLAFIALSWVMVLAGGKFLEYPASYVKPFIFLIELSATVSIGFILLTLFAASAKEKV